MFAGFRFPREMISVAVRWYLRYGLSYRDVEELLAERGITVDHITIYMSVQRFTPEFIEAARPARHLPGDRWFTDETYLKVAGRWAYLYRAVNQNGQVIDILLSGRRDLAAARRFFTRALRAGTVPAEVTTDRAPVYPRVLDAGSTGTRWHGERALRGHQPCRRAGPFRLHTCQEPCWGSRNIHGWAGRQCGKPAQYPCTKYRSICAGCEPGRLAGGRLGDHHGCRRHNARENA